MNLKSNMLKILVVFALIMMIIPAIAAEDTAQDEEAVSESEDVVLSDVADDSSDTSADTEDEVDDEVELDADEEPGEAAGEPAANGIPAVPVPAPSGFLMDLPAADLEVKVYPEIQKANVGDLVLWMVTVGNYGPNTAENSLVYVDILQGDILFLDYFAEEGTFDPYTGIWKVGDIPAEMGSYLLIIGKALSDTNAALMAYAVSDTYDPNPYNNFDFGVVEFGGEVAAAESVSEETLPATGNPIAMALLALISIVGLTLGRRL